MLGNCAEGFPLKNMIQQPAAMPAVAKRAGRTLAEVAAEIERRVADAPVRSEPFPHLLIDDLLPGVVRDALDRHWPGRDRFRDSNLASRGELRSEEHTSELQSLLRISYAAYCLQKK